MQRKEEISKEQEGRPTLYNSDSNKLNKDSSILDVLFENLLDPLIDDEEKKTSNSARRFLKIEKYSDIDSLMTLVEDFHQDSIMADKERCDKPGPDLITLEKEDFHLVITQTEFNDKSLKLHEEIKSNPEAYRWKVVLEYWFYALIKLRNTYSEGFYNESLKYLKELVNSKSYEQAKRADDYLNCVFRSLSFMMRYIFRLSETSNKKKLDNEQNFPGIVPLLEFLENCIPVIEEQLKNSSIAREGLYSYHIKIKCIYDYSKTFRNSARLQLPAQFVDKTGQRSRVFKENKEIMEIFLGVRKSSNDYSSPFQCYPDELQFSLAIFQAIEECWNLWKPDKGKKEINIAYTHSSLRKAKEESSREKEDDSSNKFKDETMESFLTKFDKALSRRLSITPVLPYLLENSFPEIQLQPISVDSTNEIFQKIMDWRKIPFPKELRKKRCEGENAMAAIVSRLTRENLQACDYDKNIKYFPYEDYRKEMESYAQQHNIKVNSNFYSYTPEELFKTLWDHSERNSDWFYYIFFDVLVPKPPFQKGELLFLLLTFLYSREDVREKFPNYKERTFKYFCETVDSLMKFESLLIYYMKLKEFMPEYSNKMEQRMKSRLEAERLFVDFFMSPKELEVTGQFTSAAKKKNFPFVFFYGFMKSFMIHTYHRTGNSDSDKKGQRESLQRFVDVLERLHHLKEIWMSSVVNGKVWQYDHSRPLRKFVHENLTDTKKPVLTEVLEALCGNEHLPLNWTRVLMSRSLKKLRFEQFEYSTLTTFEPPIGRGGQAIVYRVKCPKLVFPAVAKMWPKDKFYIQMIEEIRILLTVQSNPHIVTIHGYVVEGFRTIGILMEYCQGGSLYNFISNLSQVYLEREIVHWTVQAACGLEFLHSNEIVHRDVKPANMLLDASREHLKISDLGIAKVDPINTPTKFNFTQQTTYQGTQGYIAPEIRDDNVIKYTTQVDVFSLGRSVWNMIYRCDPTDELVRESLAEFPNSRQEIKIVGVSDDVWKFINKMMSQKADERPLMKDVFDIFHKEHQNSETIIQELPTILTTDASTSPIPPEVVESLNRIKPETCNLETNSWMEEAPILKKKCFGL